MAEADVKMIEIYKDKIKMVDRANEETYEMRLSVCKSCDLLNAGTCFACGCYVELRAVVKTSKCPRKKW